MKINNKLNTNHKIILGVHVFVNIATIFAFIFGSELIEYIGFIWEFFVVLLVLYGAAIFMVIGKFLSLYSMRIYSKTKNLLYLQLIMFIFFSYGKTILLCLLSMLITINLMNEVDSSYPLKLLMGTTILTISVFLFEKWFMNKISPDVIEESSKFFLPFSIGLKREKLLRRIFDIEKVYAFVAAVTTILILGDATGALLEPLMGVNAAERWETYKDSLSFQLLLIFVSSSIVYIQEMLRKGIRRKEKRKKREKKRKEENKIKSA
ncbi:hypothetical protein [Lysinibacillus fusiformis]|uniref:hypothetical protein n=1 Tax=Lysinibacillus fusiformis TaxID=28031 RepID=UPI00371C32B8